MRTRKMKKSQKGRTRRHKTNLLKRILNDVGSLHRNSSIYLSSPKKKVSIAKRSLIGGANDTWFLYETLEKQNRITKEDTCPICSQEFSNTTNKVIYKLSCCRNFIHNDCLADYCDYNSNKQLEHHKNVSLRQPDAPSHIHITCPICRKPEEDFLDNCAEASAFKNKSFDGETIKTKLGEGSKIYKLYINQPEYKNTDTMKTREHPLFSFR